MCELDIGDDSFSKLTHFRLPYSAENDIVVKVSAMD